MWHIALKRTIHNANFLRCMVNLLVVRRMHAGSLAFPLLTQISVTITPSDNA